MAMRLRHVTIVLTILLWGTTACGVLSFNIETDSPSATELPDATTSGSTEDDQLSNKDTPVPTAEPTQPIVEEPEYSFEPVAYHDEEAGFELLYPAAWTTPGDQILGSRGYGISFFEQDEIQMQITIYLWDPKRDLEAWSEHREMAWTGSGSSILSKEEIQLQDDHIALAYVIQGVAGDEAFFVLSTIGDRYFELAGDGDQELLREIASTVRMPEFNPPPPIVDDLDCRTVTDDDPLLWVACNIHDALVSRNTAALSSWMKNPFVIGYWQSEWTERSPTEAINEISLHRLPADPSSPMAFTLDREQFPPLFGNPPENMIAPEINLAMIIYSEGWGEDGQGGAMIFIAEDASGGYYWYALLVAPGHFDK